MKPKISRTIKFSLTIAVITFVLAAIFSMVSSSILSAVTWFIGFIIVVVIILIGIIFDMLGIASTAAHEAPFHAMASEKVTGAKEAVTIVRNADKFASFCNDVIGDISGIVSGTATAIVVLHLTNLIGHGEGSFIHITISVLFTSFVAAFTVGGKALGKFFALNSSTQIMIFTGKMVELIQNKFKIKILPENNPRK